MQTYSHPRVSAQVVATPLAEQQDALYRKLAWRLIPFLFICYLVNFLDRTNIGFAQLALKQDLGFSNAVYGLGAGLFYVGYILFEVPSNILLKRVGARLTMMRIMVSWGLFSMAMALIATPGQFYLLRFLLGMAEAGFMPGILYYLSCWIPASRRARFTALFMLAIPASGCLGGPLSGFIMHFMPGAHGLFGWQWMFLLEGCPAVLLGIVAYCYLKDSPQEASWLEPQERQLLLRELAQEQSGVPAAATSGQALLAVLRQPMLYVLVLFCMAMNGSIGGFSFWLPSIVKGFGVTDPLHIGALVSLPYLAAGVSLFLIGRSSDRKHERRWHASLSMICAGLAWLALPWLGQNSQFSAMLLVSVATAATLGCLACFWAMIPLYFPAQVAIAFALVSTLGSLGSLASPLIVGWISELSGKIAYGTLYLGVMLLLGAIVMLVCTRSAASLPASK